MDLSVVRSQSGLIPNTRVSGRMPLPRSSSGRKTRRVKRTVCEPVPKLKKVSGGRFNARPITSGSNPHLVRESPVKMIRGGRSYLRTLARRFVTRGSWVGIKRTSNWGRTIFRALSSTKAQSSSLRAVGLDVGGREVAQQLAVGRAGLYSVVAVAGIEGQTEALALLDDGGVTVAFAGVGPAGRLRLGLSVGEQQMVGDVLVAVGALLRQVVGPAEELEDRPDEVLLGEGLVGLPVPGEVAVDAGEALPEAGVGRSFGWAHRPFAGGLDAVGEEVVGERVGRSCVSLSGARVQRGAGWGNGRVAGPAGGLAGAVSRTNRSVEIRCGNPAHGWRQR